MDLRYSTAFDSAMSSSITRGQEGRFVGPDGVVLVVTSHFVKPGKGKAFIRCEIAFQSTTQVRADVVAAWLWSRRIVSLVLQSRADFPKDVHELSALILKNTEGLPPGRPSMPDEDRSDPSGMGARLKPGPRGSHGAASSPEAGPDSGG